MNLVEPSAIAAALAPLLDNLEVRVSKAVDLSLQNAINQLQGAKLNVAVTGLNPAVVLTVQLHP